MKRKTKKALREVASSINKTLREVHAIPGIAGRDADPAELLALRNDIGDLRIKVNDQLAWFSEVLRVQAKQLDDFNHRVIAAESRVEVLGAVVSRLRTVVEPPKPDDDLPEHRPLEDGSASQN